MRVHSPAHARARRTRLRCLEVRVGVGEGPFPKVKGLITDLINRLQAEGSEASHKSCSDEKMLRRKEAEFGIQDLQFFSGTGREVQGTGVIRPEEISGELGRQWQSGEIRPVVQAVVA